MSSDDHVADLALARVLADGRKRESARHLLRSFAHAYADVRTVKTLAKLLLPRSIAAALRARGRATPRRPL